MEKAQILQNTSKKRYGAIDGLRTFAAIGIVMMHIKANNDYAMSMSDGFSGFIYNTVITSFTNFVFLFMMVSAFGMCCGYYEKILHNKISISDFYGKRFKKIFPFFAVLVLLDVIISPSMGALYEAFADLTLLFGFLPGAGNITVIGVGWFIGLIFVFYLIFPFFCFLIENKRRAWISFGISLIYNFVCRGYFNVNRTNILYSGCFFLAGGLVYLYKNQIEEWFTNKLWIMFIGVAISVVLYYTVGNTAMTSLLVSVALLMYAEIRRGGVLENSITKFFSGISMEIYLSHMVVFRVGEKIGLNRIIGTGWLQYIFTVLYVIVGATVFAVVMQKIMGIVEIKMSLKKRF